MSKKEKVDKITALVKGKPIEYHMRIFVKARPEDPPRLYKSIPWAWDLDTNVTSEASADSLIEFLIT